MLRPLRSSIRLTADGAIRAPQSTHSFRPCALRKAALAARVAPEGQLRFRALQALRHDCKYCFRLYTQYTYKARLELQQR